MSDGMVRDLGQRYLAAAWETSHALPTTENPHRELDELLIAVEEHLDQLTGLRLQLLREAWALGAGRVLDREKASPRTTTAQATAALKLALDLEERFGLIGRALSDGVVSLAQAEAIVAGLKKLPVTLTRSDLDTAQTTVLGYADTLGPSELRTLASRMAELIDPAGAEQEEADRLAREERRAKAGRFLKLRPTLTTGVGPAAVLDNGEPISAGEARRLACDADIIPITLGTRSEIL
ncbi:MAG TPA: DUF222 domain-containing protein, partial [Arachnia sp.]|nr:DUF222 domain-containing protein [Arachnia sp.]